MNLPITAALNKLANANPIHLAIGVVIVIGAVYLLLRKTAGDAAGAAAGAAAGLVTGRNDITRGTVYYDTGIVATPAAIANAASGGLLEDVGSWLGGQIYDLTHDEYDPNAPTPSSASRKTNLRM